MKFNLSDATKRLLGPLGQMCLASKPIENHRKPRFRDVFGLGNGVRRIFDKSKKAFETFRSHRLRYHTMHYTFWSNFATWFSFYKSDSAHF